jgi:hypothetical protein
MVLAGLAGGCGPSEQEVGQAMLLWALPLAGITIAFERGYVRVAYRRLTTKPTLSAQFNGWLFGGISVMSVVSLVRGFTGEHFLIIGIILSVGYCGYLGFALVFSHLGKAPSASKVAVALPIALVVVPGFLLAMFGHSDPETGSGLIWLIVPLLWASDTFIGCGVLLVAFLFAWVAPHKPPPPIPPARVSR